MGLGVEAAWDGIRVEGFGYAGDAKADRFGVELIGVFVVRIIEMLSV